MTFYFHGLSNKFFFQQLFARRFLPFLSQGLKQIQDDTKKNLHLFFIARAFFLLYDPFARKDLFLTQVFKNKKRDYETSHEQLIDFLRIYKEAASFAIRTNINFPF